jgi:hypothetical protein
MVYGLISLLFGYNRPGSLWIVHVETAFMALLAFCFVALIVSLERIGIIVRHRPEGRLLAFLLTAMAWLCVATSFRDSIPAAWANRLPPPGQASPDARVLDVAEWARDETPPDARFLLPPDASAFSISARRGQVVSFKLVPQLSGELIEWGQRLREVLDVPDLSVYESGFTGYRDVQRRMRERYDQLPSAHLFDIARKYGARYVFRSAEDGAVDETEAKIAWRGKDGAVLYELRE